ncbi:GAF domain protein [Synechococcus sp. PCC 7335]|uniref:GAF domain-containing protein n=1 Tax=Synechococcus sp. (strain ATCC 29403 / PCC 7335) TaxID=91464 RepID=UPI00017ED972|nr:GAF domain-containing protein [Synechococcus sp. PCC 7335]EDX84325.1 GAF domain protein [Synechococcus sp. PCC 7335]
MKAKLPFRESARIEALQQYNILDTADEQTYDDITSLAAFICDVPIALISLVDKDRQWFKSKVGISVRETPRDVSFCAHAILTKDITIVKDARDDARFSDNPLVTCAPNIRFYAGVPLITASGHPLGTLCVIDHQPKELSEVQRRTLIALARQIVVQLELHRVSLQLADALEKIEIMDGLIPICSHCKGIRDDHGFWSSVERYIEQHSDARLTHGICDQCIQTYYPDVVKVWEAEKQQKLQED